MRVQDFDFSVDLLSAILWQYNDAINLQAILQKMQDWCDINHRDFWRNWFRDVFNLVTANDFGLAVWSIILDLPLFINPTPDPPEKPIFGFGDFNQNFENGNFSSSTDGVYLTTEEKRLILRLKYFKLVTRGAIPECNAFLKEVFISYGQVYLLDGLDMTLTCVYTFPITDRLLTVLKDYDIIPRPAGVRIKHIVISRKIFGFEDAYQNFENGNFIGEFET